MDNPDKQATFGTRQCFTKEALEKTKGTIMNVQTRDTEWRKKPTKLKYEQHGIHKKVNQKAYER